MLICHPSKDFSREWKGGSDVCFAIDGQKSQVDAQIIKAQMVWPCFVIKW